ncbi:MAG: hypothetical protein Q7J05_03685 [Paludibacter sp.]|nr:hypothetical protein [Paludibacter sp.]
MRKFTFFFICIFINFFLSSQVPDRTVNFISTIGGATNHNSIADALSGVSGETTIWVAVGVYLEDEIIVPSGVTLIGGFPENTETYNQRIYPGNATTAQQSVLDGDYSHRVATVYGILDGFVITQGYAYDSTDVTPINAAGGGVLIDGGIVRNSIIRNNIAAKMPPSPSVIPGSFVASIGDIYYKGINGGNDTIVKPAYTLSGGVLTATLPGGFPDPNKAVAQGVIFYVDPAPTSKTILILGQNGSGRTWTGSAFQTPLTNISTSATALADMDGEENTQTVLNYVNNVLMVQGTGGWGTGQWRLTSWNSSSAFRYVETYNIPSGTQGEWYLPSAGEMSKLTDVHLQMDAGARLIGWIGGGGTLFPNGVYWSSTENSINNAWTYIAWNGYQNGYIGITGKTSGGGYAFPVTKKSY